MVDYQNNVDPSAAPGESGGPAGTNAGFLTSTTGKLVVGGVALLLVLGAIGAAGFYFLLDGALNDAVAPVKTAQASTSQASSAATETPVNPPQRSLASTFTFRNIFAPTVKKTFEVAASTDTSDTSSDTTSDTTTSVPADTLFLQSISSENGEPVAVFIWNNQTYSVREGEQVGTSPWKVLQINSGSVLMLFGDSQITLSVGQGVGK